MFYRPYKRKSNHLLPVSLHTYSFPTFTGRADGADPLAYVCKDCGKLFRSRKNATACTRHMKVATFTKFVLGSAARKEENNREGRIFRIRKSPSVEWVCSFVLKKDKNQGHDVGGDLFKVL